MKYTATELPCRIGRGGSNSGAVLQRIITTAPNRYPGVFRTVRTEIADRHGPGLNEGRLRILSFGCSTATEVLTLRAYFPDATIFGCDVDSDALRAAVKSTREDACRLFLSSPEAIAANGPYDLIFAMSVFCQYPASKRVANLGSLYPFSLYEDLAGNLIENLAPGGMLCVMNSNYLIRDLPGAAGLDVLRSPLIVGNGFIDKFARDGSRLTTSFGNRSCYSHRREADGIGDDDLLDCIFKKPAAGETGGRVLTEDRFLRLAPPAGLRKIKTFSDRGESLETALAEKRVAMNRVTEIHAGEDADDLWARQEWFKTTFSGETRGFGGWWLPVSREGAGELTPAQAAQPDELRRHLAREKTLGAKLRRLLGR